MLLGATCLDVAEGIPLGSARPSQPGNKSHSKEIRPVPYGTKHVGGCDCKMIDTSVESHDVPLFCRFKLLNKLNFFP
jgi:hypothetical protein